MDRERVRELHYIAPIANLASICSRGLLCHKDSTRFAHRSVANASVQDLRARKCIPNGLRLHEYANLYFDARNPMMSALRAKYPNLIVVRVDPAILDLPGAVITDGNAAHNDTRFFPSPVGLVELDEQHVYAEWWTDPNPFIYREKKRWRCAEVLVPSYVSPQYLLGCYTYDEQRSGVCETTASDWQVEVKRNVFF